MEFETEAGPDLLLRVQDDQGNPIEGARVWVNWSERDYIAALSSFTDSHGEWTARGCLDGRVRVGATASGFTTRTYFDVQVPRPAGEAFVIELPRGGTLVGRVTHAGQPVEDFELMFQGTAPGASLGRERYSRRSDGSFRFEEAPLGTVTLVATCAEFPRSEPINVEIAASGETRVEIEMPDPLLGRGRVVDVVTRKPVEDSWVQVWTNNAGIFLTPWGSKQPVDADGNFSVHGFAPGETRCKVGAPGYSEVDGRGVGRVGETLELGEMAIAKRQTLELHLSGPTGLDPTAFSFYGRGLRTLPQTNFDAAGVARLADLDSGDYSLIIDGPGYLAEKRVFLRPGEDWRYDIRTDGGRALLVELDLAPGETAPEGWYASASHRETRRGFEVQYRDPDSNGVVRFDELLGDRVVVAVFASDPDLPLAVRDVELTGDETRAKIRLGGRSLDVHVVDEARAAIPGADVCLMLPDGRSGWSSVRLTDSRGIAHFENLAVDELVAHLYQASIGSRADLPIRLERDSNEVEFELSANARVRVQVSDGPSPLSGVRVRVEEQNAIYDYGEFATDTAGFVESRPVHEGEYLVRIEGPGLWAFEGKVQASKHATPTRVDVRRRGDLKLVVRDSHGALVAGAPLALRSIEFDHDVGDWLASGRVESTAGQLVTDASGALELRGLPRGRYRWNSADAGGEVEVVPWTITAVELHVP